MIIERWRWRRGKSFRVRDSEKDITHFAYGKSGRKIGDTKILRNTANSQKVTTTIENELTKL